LHLTFSCFLKSVARTIHQRRRNANYAQATINIRVDAELQQALPN
jgi:hypothetical protein